MADQELMTVAEIQENLDNLGPEKLIEWPVSVTRKDLRRLLKTALTALENHGLALSALGSAQDRATVLADKLIDRDAGRTPAGRGDGNG